MKIQSKHALSIATATLVLITLFFFDVMVSFAAEQKNVLKAPDDVVVTQSGKKALVIRWKKVKGAAGYEVQKTRGNLGGYRNVKETKKTSYKDKTVRPGRSGTYRVRAYRTKKGRKIYSPYSYPVSARICRKKDKKKNAIKPELGLQADTDELILGVGESINKDYEEFFATVEGPRRKGKKENYKPLNSRVRWFSTDTSIVKVKSKWKIKAGNKPGKAYIYVRAHNGKKSNRIKVIVKDYAYEKVEIKYAPSDLQYLFNMFEKDIRDICSYYCRNRVSEKYEISFNGEEYRTKGTLTDTTMMPTIKKVLEESPFGTTELVIWKSGVEFIIYNWPACEERIAFFFSRAPYVEYYDELSPYWGSQIVYYE